MQILINIIINLQNVSLGLMVLSSFALFKNNPSKLTKRTMIIVLTISSLIYISIPKQALLNMAEYAHEEEIIKMMK